MKRLFKACLAIMLSLLFLCSSGPFLFAGGSARTGGRAKIYVAKLRGAINPGTAEFLKRALQEAEASRAGLLVIELDTPGGLVSSLRDMVQMVMASSVPVAVYVSPEGARAASAGAILTMAANIAAMAPGTNIGAAHPVGVGLGAEMDATMAKKVENDLAAMARSIAQERGRNAAWAEDAVRQSASVTSAEALKLHVVDVVATDLSGLLSQINGMRVKLKTGEDILVTEPHEIVGIGENFREKVLGAIADPNIAYVLVMVGMVGLYFEFAHPGAVFPGVAGVMGLLLGLFALEALPVNIVGVLLLFLAMVLLVLELFVMSYGILGVAGFVALVLGSLMLFDTTGTGISISSEILWTTLLSVGVSLGLIIYLAAKAASARPRSGPEALIGEEGVAMEDTGPDGGKVFVHGEIWTAIGDGHIPKGARVIVAGIEELKLKVKAM